MSLTALQMVNELLSRFGDERGVSNFSEPKGATALRKINIAINKIATHYPWSWLAKTTPGEITAVEGTSIYNLAADVGFLIAAKHHYGSGGVIDVVDRATLERYRPDRADSTQRNVPTHMTTAGRTQSGSDWLWRAEVWPVPDANFAAQTIYYYYTYIPSDLSGTTDVSVIPSDYHHIAVDIAELLMRRGPVRVGGDQTQIDLYAAIDGEIKRTLASLVSRESSFGAKEQAWDIDPQSL